MKFTYISVHEIKPGTKMYNRVFGPHKCLSAAEANEVLKQKKEEFPAKPIDPKDVNGKYYIVTKETY